MTDQGKNYDKIALGFSEMRTEFYREKKYIDLFAQHLESNDSILDVGCGTGVPIASYLIDKGFHVTGIDSSIELLKIAKLKCSEMKQIYGDIRIIEINEKFDGIIEWWCLFHIPKIDHEKMIKRFALWLKKDGILEFTTGDGEYESSDSNMLGQELHFFSLDPAIYEKYLNENGFKILLREHDQEQHLVWIAKYLG